MTNKPHSASGEIDLKRFMAGDACLAMRTRRLSRILTRVYEDALREHGLTVPQFTLLTFIAKQEPVTSAEIGRRLDFEKSTLSRTVGKMVANGWVQERRGNKGERGLVMTAAGANTLRKAIPAWEKTQKRVKAQFGDPATETLDQMIAAAHEM